MRVLSGRVSCKHCGANLEYNSNDIEVDFARLKIGIAHLDTSLAHCVNIEYIFRNNQPPKEVNQKTNINEKNYYF